MNGRAHLLRWAALAALATAAWQALVIFALSAPSGVFIKYLVLADQVHAGQTPVDILLDVSPLYLGLHVLARIVSAQPELLVQLAQIVLLALACAFLVATLSAEVGPRWAALAALLFNLSPGVLIYGRVLEPEALLLFLVSGFVALGGRCSPLARLAAGGFLGAALWTRLTLLPLLLLLPVVVRVQQPDARRRQRELLALLGPPLLALLALWLRNAAVSGDFAPTVMNPGTVFFEGNNPLSSGQSAAYPPLVDALVADLPPQPDSQHQAYRLIAQRELGAALNAQQVNALWQARARAFAMAHPVPALRRIAAKAWLALHQDRRHDLILAAVHDEDLARKHVLLLPWSLVTALALVGAIALWRQRWQGLLPHAVWSVLLLGMVLNYVSERQKLATLPVVLLLAVAGSRSLWSSPRRRRYLAIAPLLALPLAWPSAWVRDEQAVLIAAARALDARAELERAGASGDVGAVLEQAATVAAHTPWQLQALRPVETPWSTPEVARRALHLAQASAEHDHPSRVLDRAQLALAAGALDVAERDLRALVHARVRFSRGALQSSEPRLFLARCLALQGRTAEARAVLRAARADNPGEPWVLAELVALDGDREAGETIARTFGPLNAAWLTGKALLTHDQPEAAAAVLTPLVQQLPEFRPGLLLLAEAQAALGHDDVAAPLLVLSLQRRAQPLPDERWALPLLQRWAASGQDPARRAYLRGVALRLFGHLEDARRVQRAALDSSGDPAAVQRELAAISTALHRREARSRSSP